MIDILLIEDDPDDVWLTKRIANEFADVEHAADGDDAIARLRARHQEGRLPDLVLLDINMPKRNGHEVLQAIRDDPDLAGLRVVMLTTSDAERDIEGAFEGRADGFITKPIRRGHMLDVLDLV